MQRRLMMLLSWTLAILFGFLIHMTIESKPWYWKIPGVHWLEFNVNPTPIDALPNGMSGSIDHHDDHLTSV